MTRTLVVERERRAFMTDAAQAFRLADPGQRWHRRVDTRIRLIHRMGGIARKQMLEVGEYQFLMLLLVIEAQLDQSRDGHICVRFD